MAGFQVYVDLFIVYVKGKIQSKIAQVSLYIFSVHFDNSMSFVGLVLD